MDCRAVSSQMESLNLAPRLGNRVELLDPPRRRCVGHPVSCLTSTESFGRMALTPACSFVTPSSRNTSTCGHQVSIVAASRQEPGGV